MNGGGKSSGPNQMLELTRKINEATSKSVDNEKRIIELEKTVNDRSQWNNTVRGWIDKVVSITLITGTEVKGVLKGLDRYTLQVERAGGSADVIIHKGAIATIELA